MYRYAYAHRDGRLLAVVVQLLGNALRNLDLLQPVQIKQQHRKGSPGASVPLDFRVEDVEKPPVVGKPGERIGHGEMTDLVFGSFALRDVHNRAHDQKLVIGLDRIEPDLDGKLAAILAYGIEVSARAHWSG